jgi:hypothetical protein
MIFTITMNYHKVWKAGIMAGYSLRAMTSKLRLLKSPQLLAVFCLTGLKAAQLTSIGVKKGKANISDHHSKHHLKRMCNREKAKQKDADTGLTFCVF